MKLLLRRTRQPQESCSAYPSTASRGNTASLYVLLFLCAAAASLLFTRCAAIMPGGPPGGLKDTLPPQLTSANPANQSLNIKNNKFTFSFNEFVTVDNAFENLIISPTPNTAPQVDYKLRTITVKLKDTLEPNTTYTLNFGNAIRDLNENNVLKNFSYAFSTGSVIDTLQLSGKIISAETGRPDSTLIIMLYRNSNNDSVVAKEKPRYYTRTDGQGSFTFRNLPAGSFRIFALGDQNNDKKYNQLNETFAFADQPLTTSSNTPPVTLYAYALEKDAKKGGGFDPTAPPPGNNTGPGDRKTLRFTPNNTDGTQDLLKNLDITFNNPIRTIDTTKIIFADTAFKPLQSFSYKKDSTGRRISLMVDWKPKTIYKIIVQKDFAEDTLGNKYAKTDTFTLRAKAENDYGSLRIRFTNFDKSKHPVLQLVRGEEVLTYPVEASEWFRKLMLPGEYEIRILYDDNGDGKWTPGSWYPPRKQPELVVPVPQKLNIRANWDNERTLQL
jgi:uncharacterized protein (DUF2141 family)